MKWYYRINALGQRDRICIGIGSDAGYSMANFFSVDESPFKHAEGENEGNEVACVSMEDEESAVYASETIRYQTAMKILRTFLLDHMLDESEKWSEN